MKKLGIATRPELAAKAHSGGRSWDSGLFSLVISGFIVESGAGCFYSRLWHRLRVERCTNFLSGDYCFGFASRLCLFPNSTKDVVIFSFLGIVRSLLSKVAELVPFVCVDYMHQYIKISSSFDLIF